MTPFYARKPARSRITRAERERAMNTLITARLTSGNCPLEIIDTTTAVARTLYTDGHSASRAMHLALGMAARLQLTLKPTLQPPSPGPQAA